MASPKSWSIASSNICGKLFNSSVRAGIGAGGLGLSDAILDASGVKGPGTPSGELRMNMSHNSSSLNGMTVDLEILRVEEPLRLSPGTSSHMV